MVPTAGSCGKKISHLWFSSKHWRIVVVTAAPTCILHHNHNNEFTMTKVDKPNACLLFFRDANRITLLAGASALCLCFCWLEMKSIMLLLEEIKSRVIFLGGQSNLIPLPDDRSGFLWGATRRIRLEKCDHGSHKCHGQTGWLSMSRSYLAGNLERGREPGCQHVAMRQSCLSECK